MKTILAYGDSLTFGADPVSGGRHPFEDRWPSTLEAGLGGQARVIAEGLGGRTTAYDDWLANADRNGARILPTLLASHAPLDLVVVMLGTNDLKPAVCGTAMGAGRGMNRLVQIIRGHFAGEGSAAPEVILVAPPLVCQTDNDVVAGHFGGLSHAIEQSQQFATHYAREAEELGVPWFDAATVAAADPADGVHLDPANTRAIGAGLVPLVRQTLDLS